MPRKKKEAAAPVEAVVVEEAAPVDADVVEEVQNEWTPDPADEEIEVLTPVAESNGRWVETLGPNGRYMIFVQDK